MMTKNPYNLVRRPIVTEKTNTQKESFNQISFEVDIDSNRIEIARAIEKVFKVRVIKVRTMKIKGKVKRKGRSIGKRRDWKKAMVTFMPGESIDFFEGV